MTRIDSTAQVLALLRERLQRLERTRTRHPGQAAPAQATTPPPLARLHEATSLDQLSDEEFRRTLVRAVLVEELGEHLANDPGFQAVIDDVFRILNDSEEGQALISRAAEQLHPPS